MSTNLERVRKVLAGHCELPPQGIDAQTSLVALDLDSLTMMEIGFGLEREFRTSVDDDALSEVATVGDLVRIVESCPSPG
ncbi:acyl carrier protein [Streptomyces bohaiensis]|uniref:Acyl carrier protein n=1 Tax=Streptomyces bohaiensis TaxID=1431344 RepID=A0ABX1C3K6_9ACTN|nr:acyl carrier protein [Streptomyces bohaiensis]NJQ13816.1 acyl carrier protein [Streptomyces bohaiensis]